MKFNALLVTVACALWACDDGADDDGPGTTGGERPLQCEADSYAAFDTANYQNQLLRVGAHGEIAAALSEATSEPFDPEACKAAFVDAKARYEGTASLREKVQGRLDDHLSEPPAVGAELDETLDHWLEVGATTDDPLEAVVARQWVDKTLVHFFFLSVYHELVQGAPDKWDEAFGYFGAPIDNAESGRKGLAAVATKRDATNGTALAPTIYNALLDGSCALAEALEAAGADGVEWAAVPELKAAVDEIDRAMQHALAFSVGHEAFEMAEIQEALAADPDDAEARAEMWIKLAELDPYFRPLEALMNAAGGDSATRAGEIRAMLDAAWAGWADRDGAWMADIDASGIVERIEAEFGIEVKG